MRTLYQLFLKNLPAQHRVADANLHLLTDGELNTIYWTQWVSIAAAASFSIIGFLALYLPYYQYTAWFSTVFINVPFYGKYEFAWAFNLYSMLLMVLELYALTLLNIYTVHRLACITGYLTEADVHEEAPRLNAILDVGLEVQNKAQMDYGINPFQGMSVSVVFFANLLLRLRGLLSSLAIKWIIGRWLGLSTLRAIMDFSVMPLYMLLNGYGTYILLREARVVIMGQHLIERVLQTIDYEYIKTTTHKIFLAELLYDTLQFVAVQKRDYHANHYILAKLLLEKFDIMPRKEHILRHNYLDILEKTPDKLRKLCILIIHLGFLLDGNFSFREQMKVTAMHNRGIIAETTTDITAYLRSFLRGEGMTNLLNKYI
jgi:hypothetical protein